DQRLARRPPPDPTEPRARAADRARHAHLGRRAHQRRPRSHARLVLSAGEHAPHALRHRHGAPWARRGERDLPHPPALLQPVLVARAGTRRTRRSPRSRRRADGRDGHRRAAPRQGAEAPGGRGRALARGQRGPLDPGRAHRKSAGAGDGGRRHGRLRRRHGWRGRLLLRWHLLVRGRAPPPRPRDGARGGHVAPPHRGRPRQPRAPLRAARGSQGLHPHQQHQPDPRRRLAGAARRRGRGLGGRLRRPGDRAVSHASETLSREAFVDRLREEGARRYHDNHPFHQAMHRGELSRRQIQGWVRNRFYYQTRVLIKDAIILSKSEDPAFRRLWIHRIVDHDGTKEGEGGLALWLRLAEGVGLDPAEVASLARVEPAVRFACDGYVTLVRERSLLEAVASSLTEFFAPDIMSRRVAAWEQHYPWIDAGTLDYFRSRVTRA